MEIRSSKQLIFLHQHKKASIRSLEIRLDYYYFIFNIYIKTNT